MINFYDDGTFTIKNYGGEYSIIFPIIDSNGNVKISRRQYTYTYENKLNELIKLCHRYKIPYEILTYKRDYLIKDNKVLSSSFLLWSEEIEKFFSDSLDREKYKEFVLMLNI